MERERGAEPYRDERPGLVQQLAELEAENARLRGIIRKGLFWRRRRFWGKLDELARGVLRRAALVCPILAAAVFIAMVELAASQPTCRFEFPGGAALPENPTVRISPPLLVFGRVNTADSRFAERTCQPVSRVCQADVAALPLACWSEWADCDLFAARTDFRPPRRAEAKRPPSPTFILTVGD